MEPVQTEPQHLEKSLTPSSKFVRDAKGSGSGWRSARRSSGCTAVAFARKVPAWNKGARFVIDLATTAA
jgi:hypothetical protein